MDRERLGLVRAQSAEEVAHDVAEGGRHGQGQDRPEQAGQRPADDDREDDDRRVELDGVALDLRDEEVVLDLLDERGTGARAAMTATGPAVAARSTAGIAEMIGPMIGTSSRRPAMTDSRIA